MLAGWKQIISSPMSLGNCSGYSRSGALLYCVVSSATDSKGPLCWFPELSLCGASPFPALGPQILAVLIFLGSHLCLLSLARLPISVLTLHACPPHYSLVTVLQDINLVVAGLILLISLLSWITVLARFLCNVWK